MRGVSHEREPETPFIGAFRQLRDPLLLFALPITFALLVAFGVCPRRGPSASTSRHALGACPRVPRRRADLSRADTRGRGVGNPTVYPPLFILLSVPFALLSATAASWVWFRLLGAAVLASMWILGVRDWRCHVLAVTSPVVVHGLFYGNLTIFLLVPLAVAWRYRDRANVAGLAVGVAVAAKLFAWPLVVWLLLTRRFRSAAWAVSSSVALVLAAWAVIGFEDLRTIRRSSGRSRTSTRSAASRSPASRGHSARPCPSRSPCPRSRACCSSRSQRGSRGASKVSGARSPSSWRPASSRPRSSGRTTRRFCSSRSRSWPRLAPAWFFGYLIWLIGAIAPKPVSEEVCCRPPGVPEQAWGRSHADADAWYAAGTMLVVVGLALLAGSTRSPSESRSV